ncbi:hypothetical protein TeGR_g12074 [Tetraparma gracilis]|uniref:Uncharacterized protein n=1 Tax=Tetraparma gracilis TaxID=2962635 RepID=A0ABQ6MCX3_9STRA|nr:hypothetical protein TeGR_g12074 [Tetraparma gracilis]
MPDNSLIGTVVRSISTGLEDISLFLSSLTVASIQAFFISVYEATRDYVTSVPIDDDHKQALSMGLGLGLAIAITLTMFPGEPFDYTKLDGGKEEGTPVDKEDEAAIDDSATPEEKEAAEKRKVASKTSKEAVAEISKQIKKAPDGQLSMDWDEARILKKMKRVQKIFGLTDEQMFQAIANAKKEHAGQKVTMNDVNAQADGDGFSLSQKVDVFVYAALILAFFYFVRRDGVDGSIGRAFRVHFPKEARALGIVGDLNEEVWRMNEGEAN